MWIQACADMKEDNTNLIFLRDALDLFQASYGVWGYADTWFYTLSTCSTYRRQMKSGLMGSEPAHGAWGYHQSLRRLALLGCARYNWDSSIIVSQIVMCSIVKLLGFARIMEIFHGNNWKIDELNEILCDKAGFHSCSSISTQSKFSLKTLNPPQGYEVECWSGWFDLLQYTPEKSISELPILLLPSVQRSRESLVISDI